MADLADRLRSAANRCTRINSDVALLCERALDAAMEIDRIHATVEQLRGENNTLAGILRDADKVLETIEPESSYEGLLLSDLRMKIAYAVAPYKREGTLL